MTKCGVWTVSVALAFTVGAMWITGAGYEVQAQDSKAGGKAEAKGLVDKVRELEAAVSALRGQVVPVGTIVAFAGASTSIPAGWLECNGQPLRRDLFGDLFQKIGTTWGSGDGINTFNVPDLRGRAPIGAGQGPGLSPRTVGQTLGKEGHALSADEMPSHTHGGTVTTYGGNPCHYRLVHQAGQNNLKEHVVGHGAASFADSTNDAYPMSHHTHNVTIPLAGGGKAHDTMSPSLVVLFIIRAK